MQKKQEELLRQQQEKEREAEEKRAAEEREQRAQQELQKKQEELLRQQQEKEREAEEKRAAEERAERAEQSHIQAERKLAEKKLEMQTFQRQRELEDEQRRKRYEEEVANKLKRHGWGYNTDHVGKRDFDRYKARFDLADPRACFERAATMFRHVSNCVHCIRCDNLRAIKKNCNTQVQTGFFWYNTQLHDVLDEGLAKEMRLPQHKSASLYLQAKVEHMWDCDHCKTCPRGHR